MKSGVLLDTPLHEAFSLIGVDYVFPLDAKDNLIEKILEDLSLLILPAEMENTFRSKYPDLIIIGV